MARLVAVGMSNRQVASELFISIKTVQFHLTHIYAKLGVSSRAELAAQFRDNETTDDPREPQRRALTTAESSAEDGSGAPAGRSGPAARRRADQVKTLVKASFSSRAW